MTVILPAHKEPAVSDFAEIVAKQPGVSRVIISHDRYGKGKGWAIRQALRYATTPVIFLDGDGDIKATEIARLAKLLEHKDIVVGKKQMPFKNKRKILTILSRLWIFLLFRLSVDTQTGIKIFNYLPSWNTDGWAFDVEILYEAKKQNKKMSEVLVQANVSRAKTIKDILSTIIETIRIRVLK